ncbi:unnamed protein product [Caenorhabditis auriculariae]|uniref:Uncharacterized protein n=1 Tax=Caenorhabditis auriculariae TaxID=2777116 RepID=A0A8S1HL75_9PELO|nr:unnamed protein product [Caenorhabditis auriculariae]
MVCLTCAVVCFFAATIIFIVIRFLIELLPAPGSNKDRAVFITGCDTGFGRELAKKCAKNGFTVFAGCLTEQGGKSLKSEAPSIHDVRLDVASDDSVAKALDYVKKNLGRLKLWGVVNNAGIFSCYGPDDWVHIDDYKRAFDVNTLGVIRVTHAFKKLVKEAKGRIVTVTSVNGRLVSPASGPYVVSKFGAEAYMDTLRQELYHFDVKVSILEPGIFRTPLLDEKAMIDRVEGVWSRLGAETKKEYGENFKNYFATTWNKTYVSMSTDKIHYVVDNYYHALTARFPRHRYYCGWDAILTFIPISLLPTWLSDFVFRCLAKQEVVPASLQQKLKKNL